ncbi:MAG: carbohydrate ABC transporter permease [Firmicutes bacterium]|nr:carbohydrate ABC transporter permease [Bacillota bacterium]
MKRRAWIVLLSVGVLILLTYIPLLFVLFDSFKTSQAFVQNPFGLPWPLALQNYLIAWHGIARYLWNTVIVAALSLILGIPLAAASAYGFAKGRFWGKNVLFYLYIGLLMIPWTLTLIPLFVEVNTFGMYNSWLSLIVPYAAGSQPLNVFLFRTFFEGIPDELYQSARIDGCSEFQILWRIVAPLSLPVFLTGSLLLSVSIWGDYLWPTIVLPNHNLYTASAGFELFVQSFGITGARGLGPEFAAEVLTMVPIIVLISAGMRYFVSGITSGALKA